MDDVLARGRQFLLTHGRLLERRLFGVLFEGAPARSVLAAVLAYRNYDGGLGHGLEPDIRSAESQPIFATIGLAALQQAGCRDPEFAAGLCGFLESVAGPDGLVPFFTESARRAPLAAHWVHSTLEPGLNPTAEICALLHYQGVSHPWLGAATQACVRMSQDPPLEAHALCGIARLAEFLPDRAAAANLVDRIAWALPKARFYIADAPVNGYGMTPLHFAPRPDSACRGIFTQGRIDGHLEDLLARQQPDGGWPIHWEPPGAAAASEWSGRWTLEALCALAAYGAIESCG